MVEAVESGAKIEDEARDLGRLVAVERGFHPIGEGREGLGERDLGVVQFPPGEGTSVPRFRKHRAGARVGVLGVGSRVSVEGERVLKHEVDVAHPVVREVVEDHRPDPDRLRDLVGTGGPAVLFGADALDLLDRLGEQVFQEHDVARPGGEFLAVDTDRAVGDVYEFVVPLVTHQLDHLEPLREVQALPRAGDVDALIEVIGAGAVDRRRNVAGRVERGAVAFDDQADRHLVLVEPDDLRPVVEGEQSLLFQQFDLLGHLVGVEALTVVGVEGDAELPIGLLILAERDLDKPFPESDVLGVAVLEFGKLGARRVVERRILLGFGVKADVEFDEFVDLPRLDRFAASPFAVGDDQFSELRPPVAEVVDPDALVARELVQEFQGVTDDGGAEMPDVKGFCDVRRGIVEDDGLARAAGGRAVLVALFGDLGNDAFGKRRAVNEEVEIALDRLGARDLAARRSRGERVGDLNGRGVQRAREFEAREREVAHRGIGRKLEHPGKFLRRERSARIKFRNQSRQFFGGLLFQSIHKVFSILI